MTTYSKTFQFLIAALVLSILPCVVVAEDCVPYTDQVNAPIERPNLVKDVGTILQPTAGKILDTQEGMEKSVNAVRCKNLANGIEGSTQLIGTGVPGVGALGAYGANAVRARQAFQASDYANLAYYGGKASAELSFAFVGVVAMPTNPGEGADLGARIADLAIERGNYTFNKYFGVLSAIYSTVYDSDDLGTRINTKAREAAQASEAEAAARANKASELEARQTEQLLRKQREDAENFNQNKAAIERFGDPGQSAKTTPLAAYNQVAPSSNSDSGGMSFGDWLSGFSQLVQAAGGVAEALTSKTNSSYVPTYQPQIAPAPVSNQIINPRPTQIQVFTPRPVQVQPNRPCVGSGCCRPGAAVCSAM